MKKKTSPKNNSNDQSTEVLNHILVPKHRILSLEEKKKLLEKLGITHLQLPILLHSDVVAKLIKVKVGDVVEITRKSETAGETKYYRYVVS